MGRNFTPEVLQALDAPYRNGLAPRGGLAFAGTAGSKAQATLTGQSILTDSLSLVATTKVSNQTAFSTIAYLGPDATSHVTANTFSIRQDVGGLMVLLFGATTSDNNVWVYAGFGAAYMGKIVQVAAVRGTSGNVVVWINGVDVTSSGVFSTAGTAPTWQGSITSTYLTVGYGKTDVSYAGTIYSASLYNLALSAADVLEIYEGGGAVPERFKFGAQQNILTASFGNSGGSGGYETFSGASVAGFTAANSNLGGNAASTLVPPVSIGAQYRIRGSITLNSGALPSALLYDPTWSFQLTNTPALTAGSFDLVLTATAVGLTGCRVAIQTPSNSDFVLSGVTLQRLGAVVHLPLNDGLGFQLQDASTNRLHALATTTGVSHVAPLNGPARFRFTSTSSSAGFGRAVIPALSQILKVRARALTGAPIVRLGTTTSGQEIVASNTMGTNIWKDFTIALTGGIVTAAADLFVTQDSAVTIEWDITWEPLSP